MERAFEKASVHGKRANADIRRFAEEILRYAALRLGDADAAEDVLVETFEAFRRNPKGTLDHEVRLYMVGIARRKVNDRLRRVYRERQTRTPYEPPRVDVERSVLIDDILGQLSDEHREALILKYLHGFSAKEIGEMTGRKASAVDSLLQRARERFAEIAGEDFQ